MNVAVGRIHVTVTVGSPVQSRPLGKQIQERPPVSALTPGRSAAERAYARERLQREMEMDRARWASTSRLCGPLPM